MLREKSFLQSKMEKQNYKSWQFGGCENLNFCMEQGTACNYISVSKQGYRHAAAIEEDPLKAEVYNYKADLLQEAYEAQCE